MNFHSLKIQKIVSETPDAKTIYFEIPDHLSKDYMFLAGQYLTLKLNLNHKECRRAYSICTVPGQPTIGVTVKKVSNGTMSVYLNDKIKEGDKMEIMIPEGHFTLKPDHFKSREHYFFIAGSGITPIMSMLQVILEEEPKSTCYLLYGSRDENSIIFKDKLDAMVKKYEDQLFLEHALTKPVEKKSGGLFSKKVSDWKGYKGRIKDSMVDKFLDEYSPKTDERQYYICGPGDFIQHIETHLISKHIDKKTIHKEYFTVVPTPGVNAQEVQARGLVTVTLKEKTFNIVVPAGKTILDVMIENKKDPPYSCTSGACSTCMAKVTEGEVVMDCCFALDDDEVSAGYILTCQAHPKSSTLTLTYDV